MSKKGNSRALRQLAEEIIEQVAGEFDIPEDKRQDFITALVRQWITYDGQATFFIEGHQFDFPLAYTPLGKPYCVPAPVLPDWTPVLTGDWKISSEDLPGLLEQLNRGQGAEITNSDGIPLRLSVNPKEKRRHVEPLVKEQIPAGTTWNYHKTARVGLEQRFGPVLDEDEMDALACSLVRQWKKYGGVASLFVEGDLVLFFFEVVNEHRCNVRSRREPTEIEPLLQSLGFSSEAIPEVIARLNLDQEIQFQDGQAVLWHDPKARHIQVKRFGGGSSQRPSSSPPIFCPRCNAVLAPWKTGERQQTCSNCATSSPYRKVCIIAVLWLAEYSYAIPSRRT